MCIYLYIYIYMCVYMYICIQLDEQCPKPLLVDELGITLPYVFF